MSTVSTKREIVDSSGKKTGKQTPSITWQLPLHLSTVVAGIEYLIKSGKSKQEATAICDSKFAAQNAVGGATTLRNTVKNWNQAEVEAAAKKLTLDSGGKRLSDTDKAKRDMAKYRGCDPGEITEAEVKKYFQALGNKANGK